VKGARTEAASETLRDLEALETIESDDVDRRAVNTCE
jgi:hypothetical protein